MTPVVLGISGPSGSGKSTLAHALRDRLPGSVVLQQDWYFTAGADCPPEANFCDPRWLDTERFAADLRALAGGSPAAVPVVDFTTFERVGTRVLHSAPVLVVEGMTIFRVPEAGHRFDLRYYLAADLPTLAGRKRARDRAERGKPADVIEAQLRWTAAEYRRDAALRARSDVVVLAGAAPPRQTAEAVAADVLRALARRGATPSAATATRRRDVTAAEREGADDASY